MPHLTVIRPGMLTTLQDLGRWGFQASGVPVAGPMDAYSHRAANLLLGNREDAAALEITLIGPELETSGAMTCATAGGEFHVTVNGVAAPHHQPFDVPSGARIRVGGRTSGARMTFAVRGGIAAAPVFGSRAQSVIAKMGPFDGRPLAAGDVLPVGSAADARQPVQSRPLPIPAGGARLRVVVGPHEARFTRDALDTLVSSRFTVTPHSNRMGYRLEGPPLQHAAGADILSDATPIGSLQVPGSGQPILLMADRQTTGGYPKIATVITADLPLAGQLAPGDWIEFAACTREAALAALRAQEHGLAGKHL